MAEIFRVFFSVGRGNLGQTGDFGVRSRGQLSFNFSYKVNFKDLYTKICVCSHKLKIENILNRIFILLPR